ncbi:MAG TPA: hypothetical protein VGL40_12420 [Bacillota bacterium]|jgi:hypothetical protein
MDTTDKANKGKVIQLLYCNYCKRPVNRKAVRDMGFFQLTLCDNCYCRHIRALRPTPRS